MMCLTPYQTKAYGLVPCGKCPSCMHRNAAGWAFRLMQEEKVSDNAYFLTFTYDNDNIKMSDYGHQTLCKKDVQDFFKRLRRRQDRFNYQHGMCSSRSIKYFAVGEYGGRTKRPHYHAIVFNVNIELIDKAWKNKEGKMLGNIFYGDVNQASVGYTLKYLMKGQKLNKRVKKGHVNCLEKENEFLLMSKGLGKSYITSNMVKWHKADLYNRAYMQDGEYRVTMPRYYYQKIYDGYQMDLIKMARSLSKQGKEYIQMNSKEFKKEIKMLDKKISAKFRNAEYKELTQFQKL